MIVLLGKLLECRWLIIEKFTSWVLGDVKDGGNEKLPKYITEELNLFLFYYFLKVMLFEFCSSGVDLQVLIFRFCFSDFVLQVLLFIFSFSCSVLHVLFLKFSSSSSNLQVLFFKFYSSSSILQVLLFKFYSSSFALQVIFFELCSSNYVLLNFQLLFVFIFCSSLLGNCYSFFQVTNDRTWLRRCSPQNLILAVE